METFGLRHQLCQVVILGLPAPIAKVYTQPKPPLQMLPTPAKLLSVKPSMPTNSRRSTTPTTREFRQLAQRVDARGKALFRRAVTSRHQTRARSTPNSARIVQPCANPRQIVLPMNRVSHISRIHQQRKRLHMGIHDRPGRSRGSSLGRVWANEWQISSV